MTVRGVHYGLFWLADFASFSVFVTGIDQIYVDFTRKCINGINGKAARTYKIEQDCYS